MNAQLSVLLFHSSIYLLFLILLWSAKERQGIRLFDEKGLTPNLPILIEFQLAGIFLFGILPFAFDHPGTFSFFNGFDARNPSTWITVALVIVSLMITPQILIKKIKALPDMSNTSSSPATNVYLAYFIIRILFIVAYECWFRGFLLMDSIANFGIYWAILINVCLYAVLHLANGKDEVIACFPYGLLLCILCLWQGAIWPAVVIHLALTVPYESGYVRRIKQKIAYPV